MCRNIHPGFGFQNGNPNCREKVCGGARRKKKKKKDERRRGRERESVEGRGKCLSKIMFGDGRRPSFM